MSGQLHNHAQPTGSETTIGGLKAYVTEPESKDRSKVIVFLTDIFGYELPNVRILADLYAKEGFYCIVPDILESDPIDIGFLQTVEPPLKDKQQAGLIDTAKNTALVGATLGPWLPKHREAVTLPIVEKFIDEIRKAPGTKKIGTIGFCFGGRYSILMAHGKVDAAYACHPSLVGIPADFDPVNKPLSLAVGTEDSLLDNKSVDQIKEILSKKQDTEVVVYQDQVHGFSLRGDYSSDKDKKAQDDALKQGVTWFNKYLS